MYAIYGNIYHQYTPVLLASIYHTTGSDGYDDYDDSRVRTLFSYYRDDGPPCLTLNGKHAVPENS